MIYNVNINRVENGYVLRYTTSLSSYGELSKNKEMVFLSWETMVGWMKEQIGEQDNKKEEKKKENES